MPEDLQLKLWGRDDGMPKASTADYLKIRATKKEKPEDQFDYFRRLDSCQIHMG